MQVLVSGSHGLIGSALVAALEERGDEVRRLVRGSARNDGDVRWNPQTGELDAAALAGIDAVAHLAGESIFGLWTGSKRREIRDSRVIGTTTLVDALLAMDAPPKVLVSGSAVGYYGNRGDERLTEDSAAGSTFLAQVCREWEAAAHRATEARIRVVTPRTGIVQSAQGGALKVSLLPFRMGLGGRLGSGRQWTSWIALDDLVQVLLRCIDDETIAGPVNAVAPEPVTNLTYTKTLGDLLGRPTVVPAPAPLIRLALRGLADELLGSLRVEPNVLTARGFEWQYPTLRAALEHELAHARPVFES